MNEAIDQAIEKMAEQAKACGNDSQKGLHFSQAVLNLAYARKQLHEVETSKGA